MSERDIPMEAIKEELGGGYFYRCPHLLCNKIVRSEYDYCPYCGQRIVFNCDSYTKEGYYVGKQF